MAEEIREQLKHYCALRFTEEELTYLRTIKWFKDSYIDFLRLWQPRYEDLLESFERRFDEKVKKLNDNVYRIGNF